MFQPNVKSYLYFLIFAFTFIGCTDDKGKSEPFFAWEEYPDHKLEFIQKNWELFKFLPVEKAQDIEKYIDGFHLIDLDNDDDLDILYKGWSGAETNVVMIWFNVEGLFKQSKVVFGDLVEVEQIDSLYQIYVNNPGCCGENEIKDFLIHAQFYKDSLDLNFEDLIVYHNETVMPDSILENSIPFQTSEDPSFLRIVPKVGTSNMFLMDEADSTIYIDFKKGDHGLAEGVYIDSTGVEWWYVVMDAVENQKTFNFEYDDKEVKPRYAGWMESRLLTRLDEN